jgi:hypothetical protein
MGLGIGMMMREYLKMPAGADSRNGGVVHRTAREGQVGSDYRSIASWLAHDLSAVSCPTVREGNACESVCRL